MKIEKCSQTRLVALEETARKEGQCARKHKKNDNKYVGERSCKIAGHLSLENDKGFKLFVLPCRRNLTEHIIETPSLNVNFIYDNAICS